MTSISPACFALAALLASSVAHAQPAEDSPALTEARRLYAQGNEDYSAGRYTLAAERFLKAYELSGKPALLFNLANTYERAGNYEKAAQYLRMYLTGGDVHDEAAVKARLQRLELAAETAKKHAENTPPPPKPAKAEVPVTPIVEQHPSHVPYYIAGAGFVVGGATALVFGLSARSERSKIDGLCVSQDGGVICPPSAAEHLDNERHDALFTDIGLGIAAASVATSVIYYVVTRDKRAASEPQRPALSIAPSGGGVGVVAIGRF